MMNRVLAHPHRTHGVVIILILATISLSIGNRVLRKGGGRDRLGDEDRLGGT